MQYALSGICDVSGVYFADCACAANQDTVIFLLTLRLVGVDHAYFLRNLALYYACLLWTYAQMKFFWQLILLVSLMIVMFLSVATIHPDAVKTAIALFCIAIVSAIVSTIMLIVGRWKAKKSGGEE